jgi:hypothetical protein
MVRDRTATLWASSELRALADRIEGREGTSLRLTLASTRRAVAALRFYADAMEQPRNDPSMYQIEVWGPNDQVIEIMAVTQNALVGIAAFKAAKEVRPTSPITLRKGMHLIERHEPATKDFDAWLDGSAGLEVLNPAPEDALREWPASKGVNKSGQMFMDRAAASGYRDGLTDRNVALVVGVCRQLDGVALAIELAAGRVGTYGIDGTANLLDNRFRLHWEGRRNALPRHKTILRCWTGATICSRR